MHGHYFHRRRANSAVRVGVSALMLISAVAAVRAQYPVSQDGRLFEMNTSASGGSSNYARPVSPLLGGNPFATGNVGRGLSLRTVSPIVADTTFRASLGSDSLSNFRRDSISTGYAYAPGGGLSASAFFDPARTAPSVAYLQGYEDFRPATPAWSGNEQWSDAGARSGVTSQYGAPPAMQSDFSAQMSRRATQIEQSLDASLSSAIFGMQPLRLPRPADAAVTLPENLSYLPQSGADAWDMNRSRQSIAMESGPLDLRILPQTPLDDTAPIDMVMRENTARLLTERTDDFSPPDGTLVPPDLPGLADTGAVPSMPRPPSAGVRLGGDVYSDMRMAIELSRNPQAEWFAEMLIAAGRGQAQDVTASDTMEQQLRTVEASEAFLTRLYETPLQTFAGDDATAVNQELLKAETAMDMGRYYEAVRRYERARMIDSTNPLPLLGKGHALLAAGEYVSAAVNILAGLERFPSVSGFQVDLTALIGGGEIVDIRRADLMKQLERNEDPQLRFLLGYLEMHSGMAPSGMAHLEKAAGNALPGSMIQRYPGTVKHKVYFSPNRSSPSNDGAPREDRGNTNLSNDGIQGEHE